MADYSVDIQAKLSGFEKLDTIEKQINALKNQNIKIDINVDGKNLKNILSKLYQKTGKIKPQLSIDTSEINNNIQKARVILNSKKLQFKIDTGQTISDLAEIESKITKLQNSNFLYDSKFKAAYSTLKNFQNVQLNPDNIELYNIALKTCQNYLQAASADMSTFVTSSQRLSLLDKAQKTLRENSSYTKESKAEIKNYIGEINNLGSSMSKLDHTRISNGLKDIDIQMQAIDKSGKSLPEELGRVFKQIGELNVTHDAIQKIPEILSIMAKEVLNVDTAMTNLYKVTDETNSKYNEFLGNTGKASKSIGRDISSYITQTSEWAKLGYSMDQSAELSKISSIYSNVGEVDDKTAVSDLVTVMKAYNLQYDEALSIVDRYNKLGNEFTTSAKDLGEGMSNAASMLSLGGTDLNKALALLTGGAEITQSAGELGNTLKIGQMRIQGMKGELESLGEESEGLESVSKIQNHILNLTKGQVDIMDSADSTKFRDYYDILQDVSEVWDHLQQTEQADLLETMFGKNRGNQGTAVIQAFQSGQVQKAYQATLNAKGSAMQEQERWMGSMEAKIQQFKSQFQELSIVTLDSSILKGAIDAGTGLLNILTQIIDVGGGIPAILGAIGSTAFIKNLDHQKVLKNSYIFKLV